MIRSQQEQLQQLQAAAPPAIDESTPPSERERSVLSPQPIVPPHPQSTAPRSPSAILQSRSSFDLARSDLRRLSRAPSRTESPGLRPTSISDELGEPLSIGGRDESNFYQAETQMVMRENQMLRQRIRELGQSPRGPVSFIR